MKTLARWGLKLLALATPVVIAACYGAPVNSNNVKQTCGTVQDATNQAGIAGIQVTCLQGGQELDVVYTDSTGFFCALTNSPATCDTLRAEDVDGAENGGTYLTATATPAADGSATTINMTK